jgi:excisionase family DNA binding protein
MMSEDKETSEAHLDMQPLLTVQEVAAYLQLTPETIRRMIRQGKLSAIKVNHSYRFSPEMIKDYLYQQTLYGVRE